MWKRFVARPVFATGVSACEATGDFRQLISQMRGGSSAWMPPQQDPGDPAGRTGSCLPSENLKWPQRKVSRCRALPAARSPEFVLADGKELRIQKSPVLQDRSDPCRDVPKLWFMGGDSLFWGQRAWGDPQIAGDPSTLVGAEQRLHAKPGTCVTEQKNIISQGYSP